MSGTNRLWSMYGGEILRPDLAGTSPLKSHVGHDTASSQASAQRSLSSSSSSSNFSATSECPLVPEEQKFKVPLHVAATLAHRGFDVDESGKVTWRDNSPLHPRNWSTLRKLYDVSAEDPMPCMVDSTDRVTLGQAAVIVFLEAFTTLVSNTGSSTAVAGAAGLGVSREIALICFTTTYLLAQALGGLVLPPIAETFGGRTLYITGTVAFTIGCVSMAASPILPTVIAGRIICGFTSALPSTVAVSSFENMFDFRSRIWVFHVWIASAVAALSIGPAVAT